MSDITPVEDMDPSKKNSPQAVPAHEESTVMMDTAQDTCHWNDQEFKEGDRVCNNGTAYECSFGKWVKSGDSC